MKWKKKKKELLLYRKVLLFSFYLTILVVISTAGFSYIYQSNQLKDQLKGRALSVASIWSEVIYPNDVEEALISKDLHSDEVRRLDHMVSILKDRDQDYLGGFIVAPELKDENKLLTLSSTYGVEAFEYYQAGEEFLKAYEECIRTGNETVTDVYEDDYGLWITAFSTINDEHGKIVGVLGIDVNSSLIETDKKRIALYSFFIILLITVVVYLTLRWGLKKVMSPVEEIISAINSVSVGNFDVKINIRDSPEMEELSNRFNLMTGQLAGLFKRLSDTSKELGSLDGHSGTSLRFDQAIGEMEKIITQTKIQKELQRAEKMNAIGQLAASVAHEIRNPMTVVKGFLQLFYSKDSIKDNERMYIKLMIEELNRAEVIINDYLSLARPDLDLIERVDAKEMGHNVMDLMNSFAMMSKNIQLNRYFTEDVFINVNKSELKQVLVNILKNGIEAMKDGGVLSLTVGKDNHYGIFEISDTGIGMAKDELEKIGTAFYSLKEKGTGIGLMVCFQIVERMKGKIEITSKKGEGTTFKIFIPLSE